MAFCAECGAEVSGNYCPSCGASASAAPPPQPSSAPLDEHIINTLCYALGPLTGVLFLVLEPYSRVRAIRFHAFQSIFTWLAYMVGFAILSFLAYLPIVGLLFTFLLLVYPVGGLLLWLFLMFKAFNKERFEIPFLGPLAESQA